MAPRLHRPRSWAQRFCALTLVSALVGTLAGPLTGCSRGTPEIPFNSTVVKEANFARGFALQDPDGKPRTMADWQGKVVMIFFGYTQCPDVCPTALSRAADVMKRLGPEAEKLQVLFVTVDPERDTPPLLKEYPPAFHPSFMGLYTTPEATAELAKEYKVFYRKNPGSTPTSYTIDHSVTSYVYDPKGHLRLLVSHDASAEQVAADIKQLLAGH